MSLKLNNQIDGFQKTILANPLWNKQLRVTQKKIVQISILARACLFFSDCQQRVGAISEERGCFVFPTSRQNLRASSYEHPSNRHEKFISEAVDNITAIKLLELQKFVRSLAHLPSQEGIEAALKELIKDISPEEIQGAIHRLLRLVYFPVDYRKGSLDGVVDQRIAKWASLFTRIWTPSTPASSLGEEKLRIWLKWSEVVDDEYRSCWQLYLFFMLRSSSGLSEYLDDLLCRAAQFKNGEGWIKKVFQKALKQSLSDDIELVKDEYSKMMVITLDIFYFLCESEKMADISFIPVECRSELTIESVSIIKQILHPILREEESEASFLAYCFYSCSSFQQLATMITLTVTTKILMVGLSVNTLSLSERICLFNVSKYLFDLVEKLKTSGNKFFNFSDTSNKLNTFLEAINKFSHKCINPINQERLDIGQSLKAIIVLLKVPQIWNCPIQSFVQFDSSNYLQLYAGIKQGIKADFRNKEILRERQSDYCFHHLKYMQRICEYATTSANALKAAWPMLYRFCKGGVKVLEKRARTNKNVDYDNFIKKYNNLNMVLRSFVSFYEKNISNYYSELKNYLDEINSLCAEFDYQKIDSAFMSTFRNRFVQILSRCQQLELKLKFIRKNMIEFNNQSSSIIKLYVNNVTENIRQQHTALDMNLKEGNAALILFSTLAIDLEASIAEGLKGLKDQIDIYEKACNLGWFKDRSHELKASLSIEKSEYPSRKIKETKEKGKEKVRDIPEQLPIHMGALEEPDASHASEALPTEELDSSLLVEKMFHQLMPVNAALRFGSNGKLKNNQIFIDHALFHFDSVSVCSKLLQDGEKNSDFLIPILAHHMHLGIEQFLKGRYAIDRKDHDLLEMILTVDWNREGLNSSAIKNLFGLAENLSQANVWSRYPISCSAKIAQGDETPALLRYAIARRNGDETKKEDLKKEVLKSLLNGVEVMSLLVNQNRQAFSREAAPATQLVEQSAEPLEIRPEVFECLRKMEGQVKGMIAGGRHQSHQGVLEDTLYNIQEFVHSLHCIKHNQFGEIAAGFYVQTVLQRLQLTVELGLKSLCIALGEPKLDSRHSIQPLIEIIQRHTLKRKLSASELSQLGKLPREIDLLNAWNAYPFDFKAKSNSLLESILSAYQLSLFGVDGGFERPGRKEPKGQQTNYLALEAKLIDYTDGIVKMLDKLFSGIGPSRS